MELSIKNVDSARLGQKNGSTTKSSFPCTEAWVGTVGDIYRPEAPKVPHTSSSRPISQIPIHLMRPIWQSDDAPVNRVITDYLSAARQQIAQGNSPVAILASEHINVQAFFQPRNTSSFPTVSEWASEVHKSSVGVNTSVCLANVLLQTYLMRVSLLTWFRRVCSLYVPVADPAII